MAPQPVADRVAHHSVDRSCLESVLVQVSLVAPATLAYCADSADTTPTNHTKLPAVHRRSRLVSQYIGLAQLRGQKGEKFRKNFGSAA